jgi:hypothetical protein
MEEEKFERTIKINNKDIIVTIDNKISNFKSKKIIDDFVYYLGQIRNGIKEMSRFKSSDFDYIVLMLVMYQCTDLLKEKPFNFVDITMKYSEFITKNILQQIMKSISESTLSYHIDKIVVSCRVIVQNEMAISKLEEMLPSSEESDVNFKVIKLSDKMKKEDFDKFFNKKTPALPPSTSLEKDKPKSNKKSYDDLLDDYNDAMFLYNFFQDIDYKKRANMILSKLKRKFKNENKDKS